MAIKDNSSKKRKKLPLKTKHENTKSETSIKEESQTISRTSNFRTYFVYIPVLLAVTSSLCWLILCSTFYKEQSFCQAEFWTSCIWRENNFNDSKDNEITKSPTKVPKNDSSLWVIERRSNLSLVEFIEKYDGKRLFGFCYMIC